MSRVALITLVILAFTRTAVAEPCAADASDLRDALTREARRASYWNWSWRIIYTVGAVAQLGAAASGSADRDTTQGLWVGGAKTALGALSAWTSPLIVEVPVATGDACTDRSFLRGARERAASNERAAFWAGHIGALVVGVAASLVLAERVSAKAGLQSFVIGYPVSLINIYTMPRESWRRTRDRTWTASITADRDRYGVLVAGSF